MKLKKEYTISSETGKNTTSRRLAQISIWWGGLGISDIDIQLNYINKWIQRLLNPINVIWKNLMLY